jgi:hypothetical protein
VQEIGKNRCDVGSRPDQFPTVLKSYHHRFEMVYGPYRFLLTSSDIAVRRASKPNLDDQRGRALATSSYALIFFPMISAAQSL